MFKLPNPIFSIQNLIKITNFLIICSTLNFEIFHNLFYVQLNKNFVNSSNFNKFVCIKFTICSLSVLYLNTKIVNSSNLNKFICIKFNFFCQKFFWNFSHKRCRFKIRNFSYFLPFIFTYFLAQLSPTRCRNCGNSLIPFLLKRETIISLFFPDFHFREEKKP